jgi:hypothetical protein
MKWVESPANTVNKMKHRLLSVLVAALAMIPFTGCTDSATGLVAYYPFDGSPKDASGHGLDATLMNAPTYTNGAVGSAIYLRGSGVYGSKGQHVLLPYICLTNSSTFTIALWAKIDGATSDSESLIGFGDAGTGQSSNGLITIFPWVSPNYRIGFSTLGGHEDQFAIKPLPASCVGHWAHYAMTYSNGELKGFLNGVLIASMTTKIAQYGSNVALGRHWWDGGESTSTRFIGGIDEVRIYNRALSEREIQQLCRARSD